MAMTGNAHDELRAHWPRYLVIIALLVFLIIVRRVLPPFIIAAILAYVFSPVVDQLELRLRLSRLAGVFLFFAMTLIPLGVAAYFIVPRLLAETSDFIARAPDIITSILTQIAGSDVVNVFGGDMYVSDLSDQILGSVSDFLGQPGEAIHVATIAVETILNTVLTIVLLFYFLLDRERFGYAVLSLLPAHVRDDFREAAGRVHLTLGRYLRGVIFLVFLMSVVSWLGLTFIFHLPFALPIAIATGFLEIIPLVGPIVAGAIAVLVGLEVGGISLAIWIAVYYYVVRQIEDQFVAPNVLGHAVELHPVLVIFAVLAGGAIAGVLGMVLAIPVAAAIRVLMDYWDLID